MPAQWLSGLQRVPAVVGSLLGVVAVVVLLAGCSGASSSSGGQDPVAAGEAWVQEYWDAAAARTRDQAPFLTEGVFFDHLTDLDQWFVGRWRTIEWYRGFFGDEVDEMTYGQPYFDIDGVVYPYTVDLEDAQDFAGLIWLQIGPDGVELVRQISAITQAPNHASVYPEWRDQARELALDYEQAWADADTDTLAALYASDAEVTDHVSGIQVTGVDAILELAKDTERRFALDLAADHHPELAVHLNQDPADYGYSPGWAAFGGVPLTQVWLLGNSTGPCPGDTAIALKVNTVGQITAERWLHPPESIRACVDASGLPHGWWTGIQLPTPLSDRVTGTVGTRGQAIEIRNGSDKLIDLVRTALTSFREAGLDEPAVTSISFDPYDPRCDAAKGYAHWSSGGTDILVCVDSDGTSWRNLEARPCTGPDCGRTFGSSDLLLHEFGHAWLATSLTGTAQDAFVGHIGVDTWNDPSEPWEQRGMEWAADTLSWGLGGTLQPEFAVTDPGCDRLAEGFRILTGRDPLTTCTGR